MSKNSSNNKLSKFLMNIIIAFGGALAIILILTFGNFWPSVKMNPKNLPIGIVSLDKGISHPQESNIGKSFVDKIGGSASDAVEWKVYCHKLSAVNAVTAKMQSGIQTQMLSMAMRGSTSEAAIYAKQKLIFVRYKTL